MGGGRGGYNNNYNRGGYQGGQQGGYQNNYNRRGGYQQGGG